MKNSSAVLSAKSFVPTAKTNMGLYPSLWTDMESCSTVNTAEKASPFNTVPFFEVAVLSEHCLYENLFGVFLSGYMLFDSDMQRIAKETGFSETVFIMLDEMRDFGYDIRIFTAKSELWKAGRSLFAAAHIINTELSKTNRKEIVINLKTGKYPISVCQESTGYCYAGNFGPGQATLDGDCKTLSGNAITISRSELYLG